MDARLDRGLLARLIEWGYQIDADFDEACRLLHEMNNVLLPPELVDAYGKAFCAEFAASYC